MQAVVGVRDFRVVLIPRIGTWMGGSCRREPASIRSLYFHSGLTFDQTISRTTKCWRGRSHAPPPSLPPSLPRRQLQLGVLSLCFKAYLICRRHRSEETDRRRIHRQTQDSCSMMADECDEGTDAHWTDEDEVEKSVCVCVCVRMCAVLPIRSRRSMATVSKARRIIGYSSSTSLKWSTEREKRRQYVSARTLAVRRPFVRRQISAGDRKEMVVFISSILKFNVHSPEKHFSGTARCTVMYLNK